MKAVADIILYVGRMIIFLVSPLSLLIRAICSNLSRLLSERTLVAFILCCLDCL